MKTSIFAFAIILLILFLLLLLLLQLSFCYYIVETPLTPLPPCPLYKGQQGLDVFKINSNWGTKTFCKKMGVSQSRNGRLPYYIKVVLEVLYDAT